MSYQVLRAPFMAALLGTSLLLSGCATREAVERAQATADAAKADAAAAMTAAQHAQSAADAAGASAESARTDAQRANSRLDEMTPKMMHQKRWHHHGRWHHHHRMTTTQPK